ncbi:MAG: chloride channel protein [Verrucomicrobia bacterium]|nr:chloride channel protein [Verrucomicrobiota bacterium]MCF7707478.1 chloride channel protein [Verrucomicrobiota bacterium]
MKILRQFIQRLPSQTRTILSICIVGLFSGGATVAFLRAMEGLFDLTYGNLAEQPLHVFLIGSFATITITSLITGLLLAKYCPEASGSGIPKLKLAYWKDFGYMRWRVVWVKFIAGVLSIGGGNSLGREGPSVQVSGALASNLAGVLGESKQNRRPAAAAGAATGLATAFNTPFAATTFTLEEIVHDLNSRFLGGALVAAFIGAIVVRALIGEQPAFILEQVSAPDWRMYFLVPVVAVAASVVGVFFQKSTLAIRSRRKGFENVPLWIRPVIGAVITWVIGSAIFSFTGRLGVFGVGYGDLSAALHGEIGWKLALLLLVAKLIATASCYGFHSSGGIFSPMLFLGGMCGVFLSGLFGVVMEIKPHDQLVLAIVGMTACLGTVVRAPVTSILIVFEMTHEFAVMPALMLSTLLSQGLARKLCKHSFYDALLVQDGHDIEHVIPPRDLQSWLQLPVSAIAYFRPVVIESLDKEEISRVLKSYPYQRFPVVLDGKLVGMLRRDEAEEAIAEGREPELVDAVVCMPSQTIQQLQNLLIESETGAVVLQDKMDGKVLGIVTLHDLLRAEVTIVKENA